MNVLEARMTDSKGERSLLDAKATVAGLRHAVATARNVSDTQVELEEISATDARNDFAHMLETAARRGVVVIHKQNAPKAVLVSFDEFNALVARPARKLDTLSAEFDQLLARMQKPAARAGMKKAFDAPSESLGQAALADARTRRKLA
jgi:antitoxin Phd